MNDKKEEVHACTSGSALTVGPGRAALFVSAQRDSALQRARGRALARRRPLAAPRCRVASEDGSSGGVYTLRGSRFGVPGFGGRARFACRLGQ